MPLWCESWTGRYTRSFLQQECWSLLTSCYSQFSHKADVRISRLAFNARTAWTLPNWWQTPRRCYHDSLENVKQLWDVTVVDALSPSHLNQGSLCNPGTTATDAEVRKIEMYREILDNGYIFEWCPWKYRILEASAMKCSSRVSVKCSSYVRWSTSWEFLEATDLNGSDDRQCGLCSRNCERQNCVWRNSFTYGGFLYLYIISFFSETCFYRSTGILAGMSRLAVVLCCCWSTLVVAGRGFPLSLQIMGECLLPSTCWPTWHLIDDEDPIYLIVEKKKRKKKCSA